MSSWHVVLHDEENKPRKQNSNHLNKWLSCCCLGRLLMKPWRSAMELRRLLLKLTSQS
jgi:hypothetical protein